MPSLSGYSYVSVLYTVAIRSLVVSVRAKTKAYGYNWLAAKSTTSSLEAH